MTKLQDNATDLLLERACPGCQEIIPAGDICGPCLQTGIAMLAEGAAAAVSGLGNMAKAVRRMVKEE